MSQCFSKELNSNNTKIPKPTSFFMVVLCSASSSKPFKHCSKHSTLSIDQEVDSSIKQVPRNSLQYFQVCFQVEINHGNNAKQQSIINTNLVKDIFLVSLTHAWIKIVHIIFSSRMAACLSEKKHILISLESQIV